MDDDCDGSTLVRRDFVSGLAGGSNADFAYAPGQKWPGAGPQDGVSVSVGYPLTWNQQPTWTSGDLHVSVNVKAYSGGAACRVRVMSGATTWYFALAPGNNDAHATGIEPGNVINQVQVECTAGSLVVDWLTIQNGAAMYAPVQDVTTNSWKSMYTPGKNQGPAFARTDEYGAYMMVGTEAGFAWSDDLVEWHMANGTRADIRSKEYLWFEEALSIWDPSASALPTWWAIIAGTEGGGANDHDGLWWSEDLGASWTRSVAGFYSARIRSDCPDDSGKEDAHRAGSGRLLLQNPGTDGFFALENGDATSSPDRGLYQHHGGTTVATYCKAVDASLPEKKGSALELIKDGADNDILLVGFRVVPGDPGPDDSAATLYACTLPGGSCVGLRDVPFDHGSCLPIVDGELAMVNVDVRDMVADPSVGDEGIVYLADGGYRGVTTTSGDECVWDPDTTDTTVWKVDLSGVDIEQVIADHLADSDNPAYIQAVVEDTDDWGAEPSWIPTGKAFTDACGITTPHHGDLFPLNAGDSGGSVTTLAIDPAGQFLFTHTAQELGVSGVGRDYACPTMFRLDLDDIDGTWQPMSEWTDDDTEDDANRDQRVSVTSADPDIVAGEPILESYTDRVVTALTFFGGDLEPDLFVGSYYNWVIPYEAPVQNACYTGWNSDYDLFDRDCTFHDIAWGDDVAGFDIYDPSQLGVCHSCAVSGAERVDLVATVGGQTSGFMAYAEDATGHREAADVDCHWGMLQSGSHAQAVWEDPAGAERPQLWTAFTSAGGGILFAEWDDESDPSWDEDWNDGFTVDQQEVGWSNEGYGTPCWDARASPGNSFDQNADEYGDPSLGAGREVWECTDGVSDLGTASTAHYVPWYSCSPTEGLAAYLYDDASDGVSATGVAYITTLDVVAQDLALAGADDIVGTGGGGVWLIHHQSDGALGYTKIAGFTDTNPDDGLGGTCVEGYPTLSGQYPFFEHVAYGGTPAIVVDRTWWSDPARIGVDPDGNETHELRAFAASMYRACGVVEIRATLAYDLTTDTWAVSGTPQWLSLDYDGDAATLGSLAETVYACKPVPRDGEIRGLELVPDGEWLMVFGGPNVSNGTDHGTFLVTAGNDMGVCAIRVGDERDAGSPTWPDAEAPNPDEVCTDTTYTTDCPPLVSVPYHAEQAVSRTMPVATSFVLAHPYVEDAYFGGVTGANCKSCPTTYPALAPYALQRKVNGGVPAWTWKRLPIDTTGGNLQQPWANELAWGASEEGGDMDRLYHAAAIGGMWEGVVSW